MAAQIDMFDPGDYEYDLGFIKANPIPSFCMKGGHRFCKDRIEKIYAPELDNVRCFWCGSKLKPADDEAYRERLQNLWKHVSK